MTNQLHEIQRSIGRIEGKLDQLIKDNDNLEPRMRKVENKQHYYGGAAAMIGLVGSYLLNMFKV